MKIGSLFLLVITLGLPFSSSAATKRKYTVDGQPLEVSVDTFAPSIEVTKNATSTHPLVGLYLRYSSLLAADEIDKAAELTAGPENTRKHLNAYKQRLGGDKGFRAQMDKIFSSHVRMTHVVELGNARMLLCVHPDDGVFGVFFNCVNGRCQIDDELDDAPAKSLGPLFNELRIGRIKL